MKSIFLPPGEGRSYPMGRISALFKADGDKPESATRYLSGGSSPTRNARERILTTRKAE